MKCKLDLYSSRLLKFLKNLIKSIMPEIMVPLIASDSEIDFYKGRKKLMMLL